MTTGDRIAAVAVLGTLMYLVVFSLGGRIDTIREAYDSADELLVGRIERVENELSEIRNLLEEIPEDVRNLPAYQGTLNRVVATVEEVTRQMTRFDEALRGFNERLVVLERP